MLYRMIASNYGELLREIFADLPDVMITFKDPGSISEDGNYTMELEESSRQYLRGITLRVWKESAFVADTYSLVSDYEIKTYATALGRKLSRLRVGCVPTGKVYALDSHPLLVSVYSSARAQIYSAPVCVNGEDTYYSFVAAESPLESRERILYTMLGTLFDENGLPSRAVEQLKNGDRVKVYSAADEAGEILFPGEEFTIEEDNIMPGWVSLPEGKYRCQYIVSDIIGRKVGSDYCIFEIEEKDGESTVQLKQIAKNPQQ